MTPINKLGQCRLNRVHVLYSNRTHLHTKWWLPETRGQIHLLRKYCLIYGKWHQYVTSEKAWSAIDRQSVIWKSNISDKNKTHFFPSGSHVHITTWMLTKHIEKKFGTQYPTKEQLYGHLPYISKTIQIRRTRHAGLCLKSENEPTSDVFRWTLYHVRESLGRSTRTYLQQLSTDKGYSQEDMPEARNDRGE